MTPREFKQMIAEVAAVATDSLQYADWDFGTETYSWIWTHEYQTPKGVALFSERFEKCYYETVDGLVEFKELHRLREFLNT